MYRVAWVMVNHNGGEETVLSVKSVLADLGPDDTLVLVDNGTTDGSGQEATSLSPRIHYLSHEENLTFAAATNRGIQHIRAKGCLFIGLINPDVRVSAGMTDALVISLRHRSTADIGAVSPVILYDNPPEKIWFAGGSILFPFGWILHKGNLRALAGAYRYAGTTSYLTGCCFLASEKVWDTVGLLDESYGMYAEDADWSLRARKAGYKLVVEPSGLLVHRVSSSSGGGRTPFKMTYRTMANRRFFKKYTPFWMKPLQKVLEPLVATAYGVFLLFKGERDALHAYKHARKLPLGEKIPWPPSQGMTRN